MDKVHLIMTKRIEYDYQLKYMSVLSQYHVQFITKIMFGRKFCGITSDGPLMDDFINDFDSIEGANVLLNGIRSAIVLQAGGIERNY